MELGKLSRIRDVSPSKNVPIQVFISKKKVMDERFFDRNAMKIHKYQSKRIVGCWLLLWSLTTANWSTIGHANNVIAIGPRGSRDSNFVHIFGRNDTSPV